MLLEQADQLDTAGNAFLKGAQAEPVQPDIPALARLAAASAQVVVLAEGGAAVPRLGECPWGGCAGSGQGGSAAAGAAAPSRQPWCVDCTWLPCGRDEWASKEAPPRRGHSAEGTAGQRSGLASPRHPQAAACRLPSRRTAGRSAQRRWMTYSWGTPSCGALLA